MDIPMRDCDLWDISDVAAYLGITRNAVHNLIARAAKGLPAAGPLFPRPDRAPDPRTGRHRAWRSERIKVYAARRPGSGRWHQKAGAGVEAAR